MKYSQQVIDKAKILYLKRNNPIEIAQVLEINSSRVVYQWAEKFNWKELLKEEQVEDAIARRVILLTDLHEKNPQQLKELDMLIEKHIKLIKVRSQPPNTAILKQDNHSDGINEPNTKPKKSGRKPKNYVGDLTQQSFAELQKSYFKYQHVMRENMHHRIRNILKSRQIGATFYFACEALEDAILTGDNQVFLSASRAQAEIFRTYIINIAKQFLDVELKGNPIVLSNGAELRFCSTNSSTSQGFHGHVYIDEYFWIPRFDELNKLAGAMATHKKWRKTYFSTPSSKSHEAYPFWSGQKWRGSSKTREKVNFPTVDEMRDSGKLCPDKQWRYVVNIYDAQNGGCDLFDIYELKEEYSKSDFDNLFMCVFVDGNSSVFAFSKLEKAMVDCKNWKGIKESDEVWAGYDPSRTRDNACFVIVHPPKNKAQIFRVLEKVYWKGLNFQYQASQIDEFFNKYNISYLGIDTTGIGAAVFDLVSANHPREAHAIHYSNENKNRLVLKMIDVIDNNRIQWDAEHKDIAMAFMAIKRVPTQSGNMLTFKAERSSETGHADAFWALSHAIINEPINTENTRQSSYTIGT